MVLTEIQLTSLATMPKISGFFSMTLSCLILLAVLRQYSRTRKKTYHRLIGLIALMDVCGSFCCVMGTWPMPKGTGLWAIGNERTCQAQGAFVHFATVNSFAYQGFLSLYFMLIIRFGWTESRVEAMEPIMHFTSWGLAAATTSIAGVLGAYNPTLLWCWIGPRAGEVSQELSFKLRWYLFYMIVWASIIFNVANTIIIFFHMQRLRRKAAHEVTKISDPKDDEDVEKAEKSTAASPDVGAVDEAPLRTRELPISSSLSILESSIDPALKEHRELILAATKRLVGNNATANQDNERDSSTVKSSVSEDIEPVASAKPTPTGAMIVPVTTKESSRVQRPSQDIVKLRQFATQSFLYVGAFFVSWTSISVLRLIEAVGDASIPFWFVLLAASTVPIQGVPNLLIFLRPKTMRLRSTNPNIGWARAMMIALWQRD